MSDQRHRHAKNHVHLNQKPQIEDQAVGGASIQWLTVTCSWLVPLCISYIIPSWFNVSLSSSIYTLLQIWSISICLFVFNSCAQRIQLFEVIYRACGCLLSYRSRPVSRNNIQSVCRLSDTSSSLPCHCTHGSALRMLYSLVSVVAILRRLPTLIYQLGRREQHVAHSVRSRVQVLYHSKALVGRACRLYVATVQLLHFVPTLLSIRTGCWHQTCTSRHHALTPSRPRALKRLWSSLT